jgi:hypothetical protein
MNNATLLKETNTRAGAKLQEMFARMSRTMGGEDESEQIPSLQELRFASVPGGEAFSELLAFARAAHPDRPKSYWRDLAFVALTKWQLAILDADKSYADEVRMTLANVHSDSGMAEWAYLAFPTIGASLSTIASLLATNDARGSEVSLPFDSFCITVPDGIIGTSEAMIFAHAITTSPAEGKESQEKNGVVIRLFWSRPQATYSAMFLESTAATMADDLESEISLLGWDAGLGEEQIRARVFASRVVGGVCLALCSDNATLKRRVAGKSVPVKKGPLVGGTYVLGLPVKCDLTKEVSDWVHGRAKSITRSAVRWLVRGHWRMQACGIQSKEHRRLWIAPYWKGPERAAALVRPHIIEEARGVKPEASERAPGEGSDQWRTETE